MAIHLENVALVFINHEAALKEVGVVVWEIFDLVGIAHEVDELIHRAPMRWQQHRYQIAFTLATVFRLFGVAHDVDTLIYRPATC